MNYIVLSNSRSGTNFLRELLNNQPDLYCAGEIYNHWQRDCYLKPNVLGKTGIVTPHIRKQTNDLNAELKNWTNNDPTLLKKYTDIEGFLNIFFSKCPEARHKGFKIFYNHIISGSEYISNFPSDFFSYLRDNNFKIIVLIRANWFMRELSRQKARKTLVYIPFYNEQTNVKIKFNIKQYLKNVQMMKDFIQYSTQQIDLYGLNSIEVTYEDLLLETGSTLKTIVNFITDGDREIIIPELTIKKQNMFTLEEQISNLDEVRAVLKNDLMFHEALNAERGKL